MSPKVQKTESAERRLRPGRREAQSKFIIEVRPKDRISRKAIETAASSWPACTR